MTSPDNSPLNMTVSQMHNGLHGNSVQPPLPQQQRQQPQPSLQPQQQPQVPQSNFDIFKNNGLNALQRQPLNLQPQPNLTNTDKLIEEIHTKLKNKKVDSDAFNSKALEIIKTSTSLIAKISNRFDELKKSVAKLSLDGNHKNLKDLENLKQLVESLSGEHGDIVKGLNELNKQLVDIDEQQLKSSDSQYSTKPKGIFSNIFTGGYTYKKKKGYKSLLYKKSKKNKSKGKSRYKNKHKKTQKRR